ncbi:ACT domain-containing protein [Prosthecochloris sp. SCSIO W1101]|uniref:ACT domain-containing protein n=1 Tax=Prosthecochloris sp. SCSIO W1101 TaxID=2992242 RepID=UPI00223CB14C|nr:ACT domain-containing protein [Prosthecochloris sp. SCSIO W1101]UZJ40299.1 ACT domain-containing protein [Prosthecochloris sp. SCSIO W1101]
MIIKQLSVFLENKIGRLTEITGILAEHDINISAFSIADSTDFGILRMITSDPDLAENVLKANGFAVKITDVVCLIVPHNPGGLHKALRILSDNGVAIDYMYAYATGNSAVVVIRADSLEKIINVLQQHEHHFLQPGTNQNLNNDS